MTCALKALWLVPVQGAPINEATLMITGVGEMKVSAPLPQEIMDQILAHYSALASQQLVRGHHG